jgi:hypothetical protein
MCNVQCVMCNLCMHEAVLHIQCCQIYNSKRWLGMSLSWGSTCSSAFSFLHWRWRQHLALYLHGRQSLYLCTWTVGVHLLHNEHDIFLQFSPYTANCYHQPISTDNAFTHWLATTSWVECLQNISFCKHTLLLFVWRHGSLRVVTAGFTGFARQDTVT